MSNGDTEKCSVSSLLRVGSVLFGSYYNFYPVSEVFGVLGTQYLVQLS